MKLMFCAGYLCIGSLAYAMDSLPNKAEFPLHYATATNNIDQVRMLTENKTPRHILNAVTKKDSRGRLPLHWAAAKGNQTIVSYLIVILGRCYADNDPRWIRTLSETDHMGKTAAQLALENGYDEIFNDIQAAIDDCKKSMEQNPPTRPLTPVVRLTSHSEGNWLQRYAARTLFYVSILLVIGLEIAHGSSYIHVSG